MSGKRHMLVDVATGAARTVVPEPPVLSSAQGPWPGVLLEQHAPGGSLEVLDVASPEHMVVVQLRESKDAEWKENGRFRSVRFSRGQVSLIPAMVPFSFRTHHCGDVVSVVLEPRFLRCATHDLFSGPDRLELRPMTPLSDPFVSSLGLALKAEAEAGFAGGRTYGESLASALAAHLVRRYSNARPATRRDGASLTRQQLRRAIDFIHDHLSENVSLLALAAEAGLSLFHFARLFKQSTGMAPHQYVIQCRVERARELLLSSVHPTADIALQVGFCDQSHLTAHFKRVFGVTPRRFRNEHGARKDVV